MISEQNLVMDDSNCRAIAAHVFKRVWRTTLEEPGFAVVCFKTHIDSLGLRAAMWELVRALPEPIEVERVCRFDQQVSSKFHRDGAPLASLLVLGYEPTTVRSRFWVADVSAAASAQHLTLNDYLAAHNLMVPEGEALLRPFTTEISMPVGKPFILAINNSQLPIIEGEKNPLGVLHRAVITERSPVAQRVINSLGLTPAPAGSPGMNRDLERFLTRDDLD